jgi:hypothetical protein
VSADDVTWLIELTAPRVRRTTRQQLSTVHGMTDREIEDASNAVLEALESANQTRPQLAARLAEMGWTISGNALMTLLADLELQTLVCSGRPTDDGTHTYARFVDRIRLPRRLGRDEALAELALRYFTGHGPATEGDLAYWATLPLGDVRAGLSHVAGQLESFEHDGRAFWHAPGGAVCTAGTPAGHLLQILDEMYRGYQESRWVLDAAGIVPRTREAAVGMALVDGQLVAAMKRDVTGDRVAFDLRPYRRLRAPDIEALQAAAIRYGRFLDRTPVLDVP